MPPLPPRDRIHRARVEVPPPFITSVATNHDLLQVMVNTDLGNHVSIDLTQMRAELTRTLERLDKLADGFATILDMVAAGRFRNLASGQLESIRLLKRDILNMKSNPTGGT